ncbi:AlbA family DNA-binding domain-containing protein [Microbacterium caowuchunii]|uniref:AlbA family DNA-binding domain-containing protein n=1 Tax=Microbacterium caowuchunii TaxID=2614638 RepID=UPI001CD3B211|nr:ATP-binding protein [Microbacterium caowuchunii]
MIASPASPLLIEFGVALPLVLLVAYLVARGIRALFGRRLPLSLAVMIIVAVLGMSAGMLVAGLFLYGQRLWMAATLLIVIGSSVALSFVVAGIAAALRRGRDDVDVAAVLAAGESDRVEFKETARWNVREDKKDARMELAIVKTVAAFLNSDGGVLVIGADDDGRPVGLGRDLATLRHPDHDRFELWLRDLFVSVLGRNAATLPRIRFAALAGDDSVCVVQVPPSSAPVFLTQTSGGGSTDLWVRVGNSTRALRVDEAVAYVARRFKPTIATALLGRRLTR